MLSMMEKQYISKHSISNLSAFLLLLILTSSTSWCYGQYKKLTSIPVQYSITSIEVDRVGDLYILTENNGIQHISTDGKILYHYEGKPFTSFEPRDGSRHFLYDRSTQSYAYLNPSFNITVEHKVDEAFAIDPYFVCSSGDHNIWIFDKADWSLKRIDTKRNLILAEVNLPENFSKIENDYVRMREYQGFLFLATTKGIHIFNAMGKFVRSINSQSGEFFQFLGEELYTYHNQQLHLFNLYTAESTTSALPAPAKRAIVTDERLYLINQKAIELYTVEP
jgi:hypothetical protein